MDSPDIVHFLADGLGWADTGLHGRPIRRRLIWNLRGGRGLAVRQGPWKPISVQGEAERRAALDSIERDPLEAAELAREYSDVVRDLADMIEEERRLDSTSARADVASAMAE